METGVHFIAGARLRLFLYTDSEHGYQASVEKKTRFSTLADFTGRAREIEALKSQIYLSRFVSVFGPHGIGKSALVARTVLELDDQYPDGIFWVDLFKAKRATLLTHRIAASLDISYTAESTLLDQIARRIGVGSYLLILDEADDLADSVGEIVNSLLAQCPNLSIATTSIKRIASAEASPFLVEGLEHPLPIENVERAEDYDAVRLFTQLAVEVYPPFLISHENLGEILQIIYLVEGSPWALKMIASRSALLSPSLILTRLKDDPLGFLVDKAIGSAGIGGAMGAVYATLNPWSQKLFQKLWVFQGAFTYESVEALCVDEVIEKEVIYSCLRDLLDVQLIRSIDLGVSFRSFAMGPILKEFAKSLCPVGDQKALSKKMSAFLDERSLDLLSPGLTSQRRGLEEFETLYEDFRNRWIRDSSTTLIRRTIYEIANCSNFWLQRLYYEELLSIAIPISTRKQASSAPDYLRLLNLIAWCSNKKGDLKTARMVLKEGLRIALKTGDHVQVGKLLNTCSAVASDADRLRAAVRFSEYFARNLLPTDENYASSLLTLSSAYLASSRFNEAQKILAEYAPCNNDANWSSVIYYSNAAMAEAGVGNRRIAKQFLLTACDRLDTFPYLDNLPGAYLVGCMIFIGEGLFYTAAVLLKAVEEMINLLSLRVSKRRRRVIQHYREIVGNELGTTSSGWNSRDKTNLLRESLNNW